MKAMKGKIDIVNWPDQYPSKPEVQFDIESKGSVLKVRFTVREDWTVAKARHNFDKVWMDSCCELFIQFEGEDKYYNLETSCNGFQLLAYRAGRDGAEMAPEDIMSRIICRPSLEKHVQIERQHIDEWTMEMEIPADVFWHSNIKSFDNVKAKGNIYKCVEHIEPMHFLSWAPISTPAPDFHRPEFFQPFDL